MQYKALLANSFLFYGIDENRLDTLISELEYEVESYSKGDVVCSPEAPCRRIGFITAGECEILRNYGECNAARIRIVGVGDTFGIFGAFCGDDEFPTTIKARKNSTVMYLTAQTLDVLIENEPSIAKNVIRFFASKIRFLNDRISTFSAAGVEQKLASYLLSCYRSIGSDIFPFNKLRASREIGVGRASLYRALSCLSEQKVLVFDNKNVQILNIEEIERISK